MRQPGAVPSSRVLEVDEVPDLDGDALAEGSFDELLAERFGLSPEGTRSGEP